MYPHHTEVGTDAYPEYPDGSLSCRRDGYVSWYPGVGTDMYPGYPGVGTDMHPGYPGVGTDIYPRYLGVGRIFILGILK